MWQNTAFSTGQVATTDNSLINSLETLRAFENQELLDLAVGQYMKLLYWERCFGIVASLELDQ